MNMRPFGAHIMPGSFGFQCILLTAFVSAAHAHRSVTGQMNALRDALFTSCSRARSVSRRAQSCSYVQYLCSAAYDYAFHLLYLRAVMLLPTPSLHALSSLATRAVSKRYEPLSCASPARRPSRFTARHFAHSISLHSMSRHLTAAPQHII